MDDPTRLSLRDRLKFLARDAAIYGGAGALNKAFALVTFPLLARHFSVEDYGLIDLLNTAVVLLSTFLVFGQDSAVARFFYEHRELPQRRQIISQSLCFQAAFLLLLVPVLWVLAGPVSAQISSAADSKILLRLMILQAPFFLLINFSQNILKWTFARSKFLAVSIGSTVFTTLALLAGVVVFDITVTGVFLVYLVTRAIFGLLGLWFVREWLTFPSQWRFLREMMPYAIPFGIIGLASTAMPTMERGLILSMLDRHHLGLFAAGAKVAALIGLPINAFQIAWGPFSLAIFKEADAPATYNWVLKAFAVCTLFLVMALAAIAGPVINVLASAQYSSAAMVVFALSMGLAIQAIGWITEIGISFSKKSYLKLYGYLVSLLFAASAIWILTPHFGLAGAAWGAMIGYLAKALVETWLAQRAYPMPWDYSRIVGLVLITLSFGLVHHATYSYLGPVGLSPVPVVGCFVILAVGWWNVLNCQERAKVGDVVRGRYLSLMRYVYSCRAQ